jgi:hypothetical protein
MQAMQTAIPEESKVEPRMTKEAKLKMVGEAFESI